MKALVEAGAQVAFGDVLADEGRALAAQLAEAGHVVHCFALDLADPASVTAFVAQGAAALGGIDALINNAAITNSGGKLSTEPTCRPGTP